LEGDAGLVVLLYLLLTLIVGVDEKYDDHQSHYERQRDENAEPEKR